MRKVIKYEYEIEIKNNHSLRLSLYGNKLMIDVLDSNYDSINNIAITVTAQIMADLTAAISSIESEVIGE